MNPSPTSRRRHVPPSGELRSHPAVRNYMLLCLSALFLVVVCLADRGLEWWCLLPALVGCLALLASWSHGPPLVLVLLAGLLCIPSSSSRWVYGRWPRFETPTLMDLVLCIAVLAYVVGHYRLLSLIRPLFPADSTRSDDAATVSRRRSADLVTAWELALLALSLPVWTGLAMLIWVGMTEDVLVLGMSHQTWHTLLLVWAALTLVAATGIISSYVRLTTATPEESLLYLQDQCWRHTRREQGLFNRWLTWARLRAQRKKEPL
jgi:hypothetical protein